MNLFPYQPNVGRWFDPGARHIAAVDRFAVWLRGANPAAYAKIEREAPHLLDSTRVVASGALAGLGRARNAKRRPAFAGLSGASDYTYDPDTGDVTLTGATLPTASGAPGSVVTDWGNTLVGLLKTVASAKQANDITRVNIARAEQGLPPIDAASLSPTLNVGLSAQTQRLVMMGGLGLLAVLAFKKLVK